MFMFGSEPEVPAVPAPMLLFCFSEEEELEEEALEEDEETLLSLIKPMLPLRLLRRCGNEGAISRLVSLSYPRRRKGRQNKKSLP
jgi:hypothetical protein